MDARPQELAETVRAKRVAIDNDLELLRTRLYRTADRVGAFGRIDARIWAQRALPVVGSVGAIWWWAKRRRSVRSLDQLLVRELTDLHAIERQLVPALGRMRDKASNAELRQAFEQHRHETMGHVERLARVFRSVGARPRKRTSKPVEAIVADGGRLLKRKASSDVRDAWLIATAQRVEHVEIAAYGAARAFANTLGYTFAAQLLQQTLEEERATDEKLTMLAEQFVNPRSIRTRRRL